MHISNYIIFFKSGNLCWNIPGHRWYFRLVFVFIEHSLPCLFFCLVYLLIQKSFLRILGLPRIRIDKTKLTHFIMLHESALHSTLQILDLIVPATLGDQLMFQHTFWVFFCLTVALMEVIKRKWSSIGGFSHYNYLWSFQMIKLNPN